MHTLASYLLEANLSAESATLLETSVLNAVNDWLSQKGAADPAIDQGTFKSLTPGGTGKYVRTIHGSDSSNLVEISLDELSTNGQTFRTSISIVKTNLRVKVYVSQAVGNAGGVIAPVTIDPRCPAVVRTFLQLTSAWQFGGKDVPLPVPTSMIGGEGGHALGEMLVSESRVVPFVVVSENEGQPVWPGIANDLAYDLTALANVVCIDEEAAWALTNTLGKLNSCYMGAIRLYWPSRRTSSGEPDSRSPLWTASTLLSNDHDGKGASRLRATIRRTVMSVAALAVEPPSDIAEIRSYASRKQLQDLEARATSHSDELEIARQFFDENEKLTVDLDEARRDLAHWRGRAERAEFALEQRTARQDDLQPDLDEQEEESAPQTGDIRFYKKTHSTPNHDVLVRVSDCGHSKWQASNKADKAKKGLEKLLGADNWKSLQHCGTCTGGGMWRVRW